jgi:hypothetical protein
MRKIALPPYLTFLPRKTVGLGQITKAIVAVLLSSLLFGAAYASVGLTNQGNIKSATIQYTCEGTPYMDYVGLQLSESIESQLASISLDQTRILLSRLYYVKLLYDKAKIDENVSLNTVSITLQVGVGRQNFPVKLIIDYFEGRYDGDGFLSYGEGNLTTEVVFIYQYEIKIGNSSYNFYLSSQTVNLTDITQYTGFPSFFVAVIALAVVFKKDKDLAVVGEESETFWRRFEPII